MNFPARDLSNQFISRSYQDVVQQFLDTGSFFYLLDGYGNVIFQIPSASYGQLVLTQDQSASYALQALSASTARTASYVAGNVLSASYSNTASYSITSTLASVALLAEQSLSSSVAQTASLAVNAQAATSASFSTTASYTAVAGNAITATNAVSSSYATTASLALSASFAPGSITSSFATTASHALTSLTSEASISASYALSASYAPVPATASVASTASYAFSASVASTALVANNAATASIATTASFSVSSLASETASYAFTASVSTTANSAATASYALQAVSAQTSTTASYALQALSASYAPGSPSVSASYALSASQALSASYAPSAPSISASYAESASYSAQSATASFLLGSIESASYALSASVAINAETASYSNFAVSAITASYSVSSSTTNTASCLSNFPTTSIHGSQIQFISGSTTTWKIAANGDLVPETNNQYSIGTTSNHVSRLNTEFITCYNNMGVNSINANDYIVAARVTASLFGTSSWALKTITSSNALSASHSETASYALNALSASHALTSSNALTASHSVSASFAATASVAASDSKVITYDARKFMLRDYTRIYFTSSISGPADGISGITYSPVTNTVFLIRNVSSGQSATYEYTLDGTLLRTLVHSNFTDTEGICWMYGDFFAISEENPVNRITIVSITGSQTTLNRNNFTASYPINLSYANLGIEGCTYDPDRRYFYYTTEKSSNGNSTTGTWPVSQIDLATGISSSLFDLIATSSFGTYATDISDMYFDPLSQDFFILSEESDKVVRLSYQGIFKEQFAIVGFNQPEGLSFSPDMEYMYVSGEPTQYARYALPWARANKDLGYFTSTTSSATPLTIRAISGQTAPLLRFLDSSGNPIAQISASGFFIGTASLATSAVYASASAFSTQSLFATSSISASYALSSSNAVSSSYSFNATSASYAPSISSSYALTASYAEYVTTVVNAINNTTTSIISIPNDIYNSMFVKYILTDTQNFRAGNIVVLYTTASALMTEFCTTDIGDSNGLQFSASISASFVNLDAINSTGNSFSVKYHLNTL